MLRPVKIFFVSFLLAFNTYGQIIKSITVSGNRVFSEGDIISWSGISTGMPFSPSLIDSIKNNEASNLAERGYMHAGFTGTNFAYSADSQNVNISIIIKEGSPTVLSKIIYNDSSNAAELDPFFAFLKEQIFNKFDLEAAIDNALTYYEDNGFPFARLTIQSIYFSSDSTSQDYSAFVRLKLNKGKKRNIDLVEIEGNSKTKDYVIKRELRIHKGEEYSQKLIDELPERLNRLRFFEPAGKPDFYINSKNEGVLLIKVKEKETNNFDGIIGYIPSTTPGENGYFTGLVNVSLRNLFGTGRAAAFRWQQFDRSSQELELKYLEPWLLGYPFNINLALNQRKQDSSYIQRKLLGSIEYLATESISASLTLGSESVIPTESENSVFTVYNSSIVTSGVNIKIDTRDDPYSPTKGLLFLNSYSFSRKKINGPVDYITPDLKLNSTLQRIELVLNVFYELFPKQVAALKFNGKELRGDFFEQSDLFRLGGTNSLRGYREDQFLGNRIFWSNFEYRYLLTRRTYGFLFFDSGYYLRNEDLQRNIAKQEGFKIGYGLGLNIETGLGVMSVSFALAKGDSFSEGKIHFGLVNEF